MTTATATIGLLTRGDDSGCCAAANRGVLQAWREGILRNASVMVPGPAFAEAAELLGAEEGLCVGLHATLTDEWHTHRWGPVLGSDRVPSLVMPDGTFFKDCKALWDRGPDLDELMAELGAQLALARADGLDPRYVDWHMGFTWFPGLAERLQVWAASEALIYSDWGELGLMPLPTATGTSADPVERFLSRLAACRPGERYAVVTHPMAVDPEARTMVYGTRAPGEIATERDTDRRLFTDPRVREYVSRQGIRLLRYDECVPAPG
ncbi:MAG: ChbG/HpnK family deacetylase [Lentisphaeria bacterium]|nr:ChbG/HpnK family deacetylase [Lentisphaeria bacterium]